MPVPDVHVLEELLTVLALPSETFVYFDRPVTVSKEGGTVRDKAIGLYNYVLDIHIFTLNAENGERLFACFGPIGKSYWYCLRDLQLYNAYVPQQKAILEMICSLRETDGTVKGKPYDPA